MLKNHSVEHSVIVTVDGKPSDGFIITIKDDPEFEGRYGFTYEHDLEEALMLIYSGEYDVNA